MRAARGARPASALRLRALPAARSSPDEWTPETLITSAGATPAARPRSRSAPGVGGGGSAPAARALAGSSRRGGHPIRWRGAGVDDRFVRDGALAAWRSGAGREAHAGRALQDAAARRRPRADAAAADATASAGAEGATSAKASAGGESSTAPIRRPRAGLEGGRRSSGQTAGGGKIVVGAKSAAHKSVPLTRHVARALPLTS